MAGPATSKTVDGHRAATASRANLIRPDADDEIAEP
jgi:hypothetical protein